MKVKLKYYGMLTETTGCTEEEIEIKGVTSVFGLTELLTARYPSFSGIPVVMFSGNKRLPGNIRIEHGSEIDCMPPFSGG